MRGVEESRFRKEDGAEKKAVETRQDWGPSEP